MKNFFYRSATVQGKFYLARRWYVYISSSPFRQHALMLFQSCVEVIICGNWKGVWGRKRHPTGSSDSSLSLDCHLLTSCEHRKLKKTPILYILVSEEPADKSMRVILGLQRESSLSLLSLFGRSLKNIYNIFNHVSCISLLAN